MSPRGGVKRHGHGHPKDLAGRPLPAAGEPTDFSLELSLVLEGEHLSRWLEILSPGRVGS